MELFRGESRAVRNSAKFVFSVDPAALVDRMAKWVKKEICHQGACQMSEIVKPGAMRAPGGGRKKKGEGDGVVLTSAPEGAADGDDAFATFKRLQISEKQLFEDYEEAKKACDFEAARLIHFDWSKISAAKLKAEKDVMVIQQMNGSLVPMSDVQEHWGSMITTFRIALESIPNSVAPRAEGENAKVIAAMVSAEITKALNHLAENGFKLVVGVMAGEEGEKAPKKKAARKKSPKKKAPKKKAARKKAAVKRKGAQRKSPKPG